MKKISKKVFVTIIGVILMTVVVGILLQQQKAAPNTSDESAIRSPYAGQETKGIKAFSQDDIEGCKKHAGLLCVFAQAEGLPFPKQSFNKIIVIDAFHHFQNQKQVVKPNNDILPAPLPKLTSPNNGKLILC